jgi:hypothetical protein
MGWHVIIPFIEYKSHASLQLQLQNRWHFVTEDNSADRDLPERRPHLLTRNDFRMYSVIRQQQGNSDPWSLWRLANLASLRFTHAVYEGLAEKVNMR